MGHPVYCFTAKLISFLSLRYLKECNFVSIHFSRKSRRKETVSAEQKPKSSFFHLFLFHSKIFTPPSFRSPSVTSCASMGPVSTATSKNKVILPFYNPISQPGNTFLLHQESKLDTGGPIKYLVCFE